MNIFQQLGPFHAYLQPVTITVNKIDPLKKKRFVSGFKYARLVSIIPYNYNI